MTRMSLFSSPFLLGFDEIEARLERLSKGADGYPPYNIERLPGKDGEETYLIALAVAGFAASDLDILCEDNQLVIRGKQSEEQGRDFLHRGIAARQFQRSFLLADGMKVEGAELRDGLLTITAVRPQIQKIARKIRIRTADDAAGQ